MAALVLVMASQFLAFVGPAAAQGPTTSLLVPSHTTVVSGVQVVLDASASTGTTQVQFVLDGAAVIATATPTIYGWIALWNSTTVVNGTYTLQSVASADGVSGSSTAITITVSNPAPSTVVGLPASSSVVSGGQYLDASASPGVTQVQYEISGGPDNYSDQVISGSTPTYFGWLGGWNTTSVRNGTYILNSVASYADGASGTSPPVTFQVDNPVTLSDLVDPDLTGTGTAQAEVNGCTPIYLVFDAGYEALPPVADVDLHIVGCDDAGQTGQYTFTGTFTISTANAGTLSGTATGPVTVNYGSFAVDEALTLTVTSGTGAFAGTTGSLQATLLSNGNSPATDIPFTGSVSVP